MTKFSPGDLVRPIHRMAGLPADSVWVVKMQYEEPMGGKTVVLSSIPGRYPHSMVWGRVFSPDHLEKVEQK